MRSMPSIALTLCCAVAVAAVPVPDSASAPRNTADGFSLTLLDDPNALCLDGSPGGFYRRPGVGDGAAVWLIEMEGGGWCTSVEDCKNRAKTDIGSSKKWPSTGCPGMDGGSNGMLSNDCETNPHFCNSTGIHMNYADGASFSSAAGFDAASGLHFSGAFIFNATVAKLLTLGLGDAKEIVLKGCSAGGLAVYLHCDLFAAMMKEAGSSARVTCMPDAGFFRMDVPTVTGAPHYTPQQQWVYSYQGVVQMDAGCVAAHAATNDTWRCFFAEANLPYITTPLFVTQDTVDSWQMANVLSLPCDPGVAPTKPNGCNATWDAASAFLLFWGGKGFRTPPPPTPFHSSPLFLCSHPSLFFF